jgi:hypothetical protein
MRTDTELIEGLITHQISVAFDEETHFITTANRNMDVIVQEGNDWRAAVDFTITEAEGDEATTQTDALDRVGEMIDQDDSEEMGDEVK